MTKMILIDEAQLRQIVIAAMMHVMEEQSNSPSTEPKEEPLLTREEMAKQLHISLVTIGDWMKKGLPYLRLNKRIYFRRSEVIAHMKHFQFTPKKQIHG